MFRSYEPHPAWRKTNVKNALPYLMKAFQTKVPEVVLCAKPVDTQFMHAIITSDLSLAMQCLAQGAIRETLIGAPFAYTPLTTAIRTLSEDMVRLLLAAGVQANTCEGTGFRPLMVASALGLYRVVGLLLQAGANREATVANCVTALDIANHCNQTAIVQLLQTDPIVLAGMDFSRVEVTTVPMDLAEDVEVASSESESPIWPEEEELASPDLSPIISTKQKVSVRGRTQTPGPDVSRRLDFSGEWAQSVQLSLSALNVAEEVWPIPTVSITDIPEALASRYRRECPETKAEKPPAKMLPKR